MGRVRNSNNVMLNKTNIHNLNWHPSFSSKNSRVGWAKPTLHGWRNKANLLVIKI